VTISPNIIAARIKNGSLQSEFLTVFLNTKYGQQQLERGLKVVAQPTISTSLVSKIKVFVPGKVDEQKITSIFLSSIDNYEKSKTYYTQAQHLLESELGLDKLSFQKPVGYTARFSELEQSRRLDAEHFYPAFQRLATQMPDHIKLVPLGTQLSFCQRGKQPVYSANGLPVINSKHVQNNKIVFEGNRKAAPNPIADLQIRYGDLLMNGTGRGTLGRAAPYLTDRKAIPDNHVTMLRSRTLDPAYLSFYLNSQVGQLQVEMHQRGTSGQLELYPFDIRKFLVWAAPESFQKEIRNLYDRAAESEQKSRELLDQAKIQVEQLIEEAASER
ncbi:MAG: hypothetical protein RBS57_05145, partial [Desulforhabdus sp.]|nr:hypothetical protein [Desulforhabdus sp.]